MTYIQSCRYATCTPTVAASIVVQEVDVCFFDLAHTGEFQQREGRKDSVVLKLVGIIFFFNEETNFIYEWMWSSERLAWSSIKYNCHACPQCTFEAEL